MDLAIYVTIFICAFVAGYFVSTKKNHSRNLDKVNLEKEMLSLRLKEIQNELSEKNKELLLLVSEKSTLLEKNKHTELKLNDLEEMKSNLSKEFENLANKIFQEKMSSFQKDSTANMDTVLKPFKEKLGEFQNIVSKYRDEEIKESTALKVEIQNIFQLNQKLSTEAHNLTKALKGDKKSQGNWGELILERVLESSGLRKGEEYIVQGIDLNLTNDEGRVLRPDVIVNLPEGKHIIVDSKVTLNGYDKYINSEDEGERAIALKEYLTAIKNHITGLSSKEYHKLDKLIGQDFVLMFIPMEGAFSTALQNDSEIFNFGWNKKIILVSPTTLMVTLRTIDSIWKQERQNKNTQEIVKHAGDLYDKFCGFIDSLIDLDKSLNSSRKLYDEAMGRARDGRGSLVSRFEKLKELGAKTNKSIAIDFENNNS